MDPALALVHLGHRLPGLRPAERNALAFVDFGGQSRVEAARHLGVDTAELAGTLTSARKALRRTLEPLPADGWCERAERLISDRIDGVLSPRGAARLEAHLQGCERCVTHERRLVQAHDQLLESLASAPPPAAVAGRPALRVVDAEPAVPEAARRSPAWYALWALALLLLVAAAVLGALAATGGL